MLQLIASLRSFYGIALDIFRSYHEVEAFIHRSPGLPVPDPSKSFWINPPSQIANHCSPLPKHANVTIIGSGITGASVARTLLKTMPGLKVVMLEARDTCSGATGRNGGHIDPNLYHDYTGLLHEHGLELAQKIIRFRLSNFDELQAVVKEDDILLESQLRRVEACHVYLDEGAWRDAQEKFAIFKRDMPQEAAVCHVYQREEAIKVFGLSDITKGCISIKSSGAVHPYRLVTGILARLLQSYPEDFHLLTNTPCTSITGPSALSPHYTVHTPDGSLTTSHVIHCTNAHISHLLEPVRAKIIPLRGTMTAQRPGTSLEKRSCPTSGARSFIWYGEGYNYLTQLPAGENELMFGGSVVRNKQWMKEAGVADDATFSLDVAAHLGGLLPHLFGDDNWGAELGTGADGDDGWPKGRVKASWSGTIGISADGFPWVGRLPDKLTGRKGVVNIAKFGCDAGQLASPGEWISGGYSGEGMTNAWMSGKAVAYMVLGREVDMNLIPQVMLVDEERWKKASLAKLFYIF